MPMSRGRGRRWRIVAGFAGAILMAGIVLLAPSVSSGAHALKSGCQPIKVYPKPPPGFNPVTASDAQLEAYGFPPRPPGASPSSPAYQAWLTAVEHAETLVPPDPVCGSRSHASNNDGRLVGGIVLRGRAPRGAANRYQQGWVRVAHRGHVAARHWVGANHRYHFRLAGGRYQIEAHTKWGKCIGVARIHARKTTEANAYCVFH